MKKPKPKQTQFNDSITGVNPVRTHGFGLYNGRRVVWSVRVDEKLLKQAKQVMRGKFGSDCRAVESWLAGLVATSKGDQLRGVYPSNTVTIGELHIERNLRSRRKLVVEEEREVTETVSCSYCHRPAVAVMEHSRGQQAYVCPTHRDFLKIQPNWKLSRIIEPSIENIQKGV